MFDCIHWKPNLVFFLLLGDGCVVLVVVVVGGGEDRERERETEDFVCVYHLCSPQINLLLCLSPPLPFLNTERKQRFIVMVQL